MVENSLRQAGSIRKYEKGINIMVFYMREIYCVQVRWMEGNYI